jgi:glycine oxidase
MDVIVIGAGTIGLAIAFELAGRGAAVRVFDKGGATNASWASAGILAPYTAPIASPDLAAFCDASHREYPTFIEKLRAQTDIDPCLRLGGNIKVLFDEGNAPMLRARMSELTARGLTARYMDGAQARELEPALASGVVGGTIVAQEGRIDNRLLLAALRAACVSSGVALASEDEIHAVEISGERVRGVRIRYGVAHAPIVINAAGAWSARIRGMSDEARAAIKPVKGQMLALAMPNPLISRAVLFPTRTAYDGYVVPRTDGRLVVGATVENADFDTTVTAEGIHTILCAAFDAVPELGALELIETWAGLRPASRDGLPFIGRTTTEGYFLATGHHRYGIMLAPATAALIADTIEHRPLPSYAEAISPTTRRNA